MSQIKKREGILIVKLPINAWSHMAANQPTRKPAAQPPRSPCQRWVARPSIASNSGFQATIQEMYNFEKLHMLNNDVSLIV